MDADTRARLKRIERDAYVANDWVRNDMALLALAQRPDVMGMVVKNAETKVIQLLRKWAADWCLANAKEPR